ncbi:hypothetical protein F9288_09660 [Sphingomonas sp. CL5.1]|uniref:hypothetical protein n=1 Tax=Sphingomonas sp. CL5.1 TaxID=2653203 RepID=UPI00158183A6|nr:hypothetical protein [Sphingomonas sp. CL5.1]QKR99874.1 hypothetical protein F9288_09660 [Sphingomonas sp. CL5.1]
MTRPVLLMGGYGVLGAELARTLRRRQPDLPLAIAGRTIGRAEALAVELGNATAHCFTYRQSGEAIPSGEFSAVAVLLKDNTLRLTDVAVRRGIPLISVSSAAFEIGADLFHGLRARNAPVVMASNWFAGAPAIAALALAQGLARVDEIEVGLVIDRGEAPSGAATIADFERISLSCPSTLVREAGCYRWVQGDAASAHFERENGAIAEGKIAVSTDVMSLTAATGAATVRVIEAFTPSLSLLRGEGAADEISIRVVGADAHGIRIERRRFLTARRDKVGLTALTVALALERLVGRFGESAPASGLHPVEAIFAPDAFVDAVRAAGVQVSAVIERRSPDA